MDSREHDSGAEGEDGVVFTEGFPIPKWVFNERVIGFDIETTVEPIMVENTVVAMVFSDGKRGHFIDVRDEDYLKVHMMVLFPLFQNTTIVGHNIGFDLMHVKQTYGVPYPERYFDTMIAEQVLTAGTDLRVSLADVMERRYGIQLDKTYQTLFTADGVFSDEQKSYAVLDAACLIDLQKDQEIEIYNNDLMETFHLEMQALPSFCDMVLAGIGLNTDTHSDMVADTTEEWERVKYELEQLLTPHIRWKQIEQFDTERETLGIWQDSLDAQSYEWEMFWHSNSDNGDLPEWIDNKWDDQKINKSDGKPEGLRRYIRKMSQEWKKQNPRPKKPNLSDSLINLNSADQMIAAFGDMGIILENFRTSTLSTLLASTDDEQLQAMLVSLILYKKAEKLLSSFGETLVHKIGKDGRLHGNFRQIGTGTGRPSCSNPNLLQMPKRGKNKRFRKCFVPAPGNLFVRADYSQMELRLVAQLSGDVAMQKAFREGIDLHQYTASLMFKTPLEKVNNDQRATAKTINFGILYGMGANKLRATLAVDGIKLGKQEAYDAIKLWKRSYPQAANWIESTGLSALQVGWTATSLGRRRYFQLPPADESAAYAIRREAANHPIQGGNADVTKRAMYNIHKQLGGNGKIVLSVYDELVIEAPEDYIDIARVIVEQCMVDAGKEFLVDIPCEVEAQITRTWSEEDGI